MSVFRLLLFWFLTSAVALAAASEPELHVRAGMPTLAARNPAASGELRVAYLGGSITAAANGWRSLATEHLRAIFPGLTISEINAGLPGTGSDLGACRLEHDVLQHRPDLLFIEFAVNDSSTAPEQIVRTMEGIVRQTWRANPRADICFVYTVSTPGLPELQAGQFPPAARAMEQVAEHYGIPSIHLGVEVVQRVAAGSLVFKAAEGGQIFSLDGVHPTTVGHRVYFSVIERSLPRLLAATAVRSTGLPPPLRADNWERASLRLFADLAHRGDWTRLAADDSNLRGVTQNLLPPTWRAATPGAQIEFEFRGRRFGLLGIGAPDSGEFRVTVDDLPPVTDTFFDFYASPTFCRQRSWFFPKELPDGLHRVRVELLNTVLDKAALKAKAGKPFDSPPAYAPNRLTLSGALVVGSPNP